MDGRVEANTLFNSINRTVMLDMAIRDLEEHIVSEEHFTVTEDHIDRLPVLFGGENDCTICLERVDSLRRLECSHAFCRGCLVSWLKVRNACPLCRATAITSSGLISASQVRSGLRLLRQLVYAIMCEDARASLGAPSAVALGFSFPNVEVEDFFRSETPPS